MLSCQCKICKDDEDEWVSPAIILQGSSPMSPYPTLSKARSIQREKESGFPLLSKGSKMAGLEPRERLSLDLVAWHVP